MNKETKVILETLDLIAGYLEYKESGTPKSKQFRIVRDKIYHILNPKQSTESVCDMKEDRICGACGNPLGSDKGCDKCEEYERQGERE